MKKDCGSTFGDFPEADANQDGQLSASEVRDHRQQLRRRKLEGSGPPESKFNFPVQFTWATMSDGVQDRDCRWFSQRV